MNIKINSQDVFELNKLVNVANLQFKSPKWIRCDVLKETAYFSTTDFNIGAIMKLDVKTSSLENTFFYVESNQLKEGLSLFSRNSSSTMIINSNNIILKDDNNYSKSVINFIDGTFADPGLIEKLSKLTFNNLIAKSVVDDYVKIAKTIPKESGDSISRVCFLKIKNDFSKVISLTQERVISKITKARSKVNNEIVISLQKEDVISMSDFVNNKVIKMTKIEKENKAVFLFGKTALFLKETPLYSNQMSTMLNVIGEIEKKSTPIEFNVKVFKKYVPALSSQMSILMEIKDNVINLKEWDQRTGTKGGKELNIPANTKNVDAKVASGPRKLPILINFMNEKDSSLRMLVDQATPCQPFGLKSDNLLIIQAGYSTNYWNS